MQSRAYNACFSVSAPSCVQHAGPGGKGMPGAWRIRHMHCASPRQPSRRPAHSCTPEAGAAEQAALRRRRSCIPPLPPEKARRAAASKQSVFPLRQEALALGIFRPDRPRQTRAGPAAHTACPAFSRRPAPSPHIRRAGPQPSPAQRQNHPAGRTKAPGALPPAAQ